MGIAFSFLDLFDIVHKHGCLNDPFIALGSLNVNEDMGVIQAYASKNPWWNHDENYSVRSLLRDRYHIMNYKDIDINGVADVWLDLNKPLDGEYVNSANVILNGGTLEHVFDVAQALKNIHAMLKEGGCLIHLVPVSWFNHGYYNFNPMFFREVAAVNKYQLLAEGFYCDPTVLDYVADGEGRKTTRQPEPPVTIITFNGEYTKEGENLLNSFNKNIFPSNLLYMAAFKKTNSEAFIYPVDVQP